ncbi:hypothetical protein [Novipirellula artificiosorum]|uniref:Prepilin-type N-terminal cleavage/methylation domain-containing protein n=1 Tax=Novipirellula artificiosorum TaxID=2528016 RepID=A0A5C6DGS3_9BACT|nr:hypothetical protein [Novipirellula artificiosorum]TWU34931.1 hypothetical protein Poly41_40750 [Novipirellula artificiosorum]
MREMTFQRSQTEQRNRRLRYGISLLEVIACTALLAVMIVPIAGVIRASARSIADVEGTGDHSAQSELRGALNWLTLAVRDGVVLGIDRNGRSMKLQLRSGDVVEVTRYDDQLLMIENGAKTVLAEDVSDFALKTIENPAEPGQAIGIQVVLQSVDAVSRDRVSLTATIAQPTQFSSVAN